MTLRRPDCKPNHLARHKGPLLVLSLTLLLGACGTTTTIHPPAAVADPVQVAVLDHGRHATLVVAVPEEDAVIRYAYGDWAWYARRATGPVEGSAAVLWPTQGALGRQPLPAPFDPARVLDAVPVIVEDALFLEVEARLARRLVARLEEIYEANRDQRLVNESFGLVFVPHPEPYTLSHNSNHVVADWLREMGCRVEGPAFWSAWRLAAPAGGNR